MNFKKISIISVAVATLLGGIGCSDTKESAATGEGYDDPFFSHAELATVGNVSRQQAASAARADATLNGSHFFGGALNSLGEQKLELMLEDDDSTKPIAIYIDVTEDADSSGRRASVEAFMLAHGIPADQLKLENGLNPKGTGTPAAQLLKNLSKTDSTATEGEAAPQ